jgi:cytochrome c oxidase assembly protein subunit 11
MSKKPAPVAPRKSNTRILLICLAAFSVSITLTIAAVPLYNLFCKHFGIPQPRVLTSASARQYTSDATSTRTVTVRFTANTSVDMPVNFQPQTFSIKAKLGEPILTAYTAQNLTGQAFEGVAVHMLYAMGGGPENDDISPYIDLQQCFCFAQEHYPPHAKLNLPLSFTVTPDLPKGVHTITFAYTLFKALPNDPRIKVTPSNANLKTD